MNKEEFRKLLAKWAQEDVYISQLTWEEGDSLAEYLSKWYLKERTEELARYKQYALELDRELQTGESHAKIQG